MEGKLVHVTTEKMGLNPMASSNCPEDSVQLPHKEVYHLSTVPVLYQGKGAARRADGRPESSPRPHHSTEKKKARKAAEGENEIFDLLFAG